MPEYLSPGVYVEEVSFRSKSIEGVPTSTTGFAGLTRTGPVQYMVDSTSLRGPDVTEPRLITSFTEFERVYGGLDPMTVGGDERIPFLAHAARAFFMNGGSRLYVARVYSPVDTDTDANWGIATRPVTVNSTPVTQAVWRARWPGAFGNVLVTVIARRGKNVAFTDAGTDPGEGHARRRRSLEVVPAAATTLPDDDDPLDGNELRIVRIDPITGLQVFEDDAGNTPALTGRRSSRPGAAAGDRPRARTARLDVYGELGVDPAAPALHRQDPPEEPPRGRGRDRLARLWRLRPAGPDTGLVRRQQREPDRPGRRAPGELDAAARRWRRRQHAAPGRRPAVPRRAPGRSRPPRGEGDRPLRARARSTTSPSSPSPTAAPTPATRTAASPPARR